MPIILSSRNPVSPAPLTALAAASVADFLGLPRLDGVGAGLEEEEEVVVVVVAAASVLSRGFLLGAVGSSFLGLPRPLFGPAGTGFGGSLGFLRGLPRFLGGPSL